MEYLDIIYIITLFIIGTLFGSFFSLATHRLPKKEDILVKQSYCPNCNHKLGFFDLFPIISYICIGGKCRYCKNKISMRYPLFELSNGLIFVVLFLILGMSINLIIAIIVYATLFVIIGSYINYLRDNKRNEKIEKYKIDKVEKNKTEKSNVSGFINTELVIGIAIYLIFLTSIIIITINNNAISNDLKKRSEAVNLAVNSIEKIQGMKYNDVNSYNDTVEIDNVSYKREVKIEQYANNTNGKKDIIKTITVNISYKKNKGYDNFELKSVKVNNEVV